VQLKSKGYPVNSKDAIIAIVLLNTLPAIRKRGIVANALNREETKNPLIRGSFRNRYANEIRSGYNGG